MLGHVVTVTPTQDVLPKGRAENAKLHGALFRGVLKGSKLSAEIESLEFLSNGVALVHTAGNGRKKSYQTYLLVKSGSDWLVRSFQNTRRQPFSGWIALCNHLNLLRTRLSYPTRRANYVSLFQNCLH
jgi:hypothetical protein